MSTIRQRNLTQSPVSPDEEHCWLCGVFKGPDGRSCPCLPTEAVSPVPTPAHLISKSKRLDCCEPSTDIGQSPAETGQESPRSSVSIDKRFDTQVEALQSVFTRIKQTQKAKETLLKAHLERTLAGHADGLAQRRSSSSDCRMLGSSKTPMIFSVEGRQRAKNDAPLPASTPMSYKPLYLQKMAEPSARSVTIVPQNAQCSIGSLSPSTAAMGCSDKASTSKRLTMLFGLRNPSLRSNRSESVRASHLINTNNILSPSSQLAPHRSSREMQRTFSVNLSALSPKHKALDIKLWASKEQTEFESSEYSTNSVAAPEPAFAPPPPPPQDSVGPDSLQDAYRPSSRPPSAIEFLNKADRTSLVDSGYSRTLASKPSYSTFRSSNSFYAAPYSLSSHTATSQSPMPYNRTDIAKHDESCLSAQINGEGSKRTTFVSDAVGSERTLTGSDSRSSFLTEPASLEEFLGKLKEIW
ncbi:hypothetical protein HDU67_003933 [Dinochytrium kinnereticum]|nr:hypothetical protein HDU67_003933 [Dinochytrium kinnereticum]